MLSEKVTEVRELAATLWFLPPPGRAMIAEKLHGLGVRVHEELATLQLEREGPKNLGNHAPMRVVKKNVMTEGMEMLRQVNPDLVARIQAAQADPEMAARINAAVTVEEKARVAQEVGIDIAEDLAVLKDQIGNVSPEDLN